jgi:hypothetical protein
MIKDGEMTIINAITYRCIKLEDGYAHLKDITTGSGRPKKVKIDECPYVKDGKLVVPEKKVTPPHKGKSIIRISSLAKESTELSVSKNAKYFLAEWAETAIANLLAKAEESAKSLGHKRITEAHIFWLETNDFDAGYWPSNKEYMREN